MSLDKFSVIFGTLFVSSLLFSKIVVGLECFRCMYVEVEGHRVRTDKTYSIPVDVSCLNNPHSGLSIDCLSYYNDQLSRNEMNDGNGMSNVNVPSHPELRNISDQGEVEYIEQDLAAKTQLQFSCAKMKFSRFRLFGKIVTSTVRTCVPVFTLRSNETKCLSGALGGLQEKLGDEDLGLRTFLEDVGGFFGLETQTDACTCNDNKCNTGIFTYKEPDEAPNSGAQTEAPNSGALTKAPQSIGKSGSEKSLAFSVAALLASCWFTTIL